jgi:hypothetical protein
VLWGLPLQPAAASAISFAIMANLSKLKQVQYKRRVVSQKITQHREILATLEAQERDLEIAERVLAELETSPEPELALEPQPEVPQHVTLTAVDLVAGGKPEGIPTMPDMIFEALRDAKARGLKGLEPKDITAFISAKWWPDVKITNVGPIAWRLYKSERLTKRQSKYRLPDEIEAHAAA